MEKASSRTPLGNASNLLNVPSGRVVKNSTASARIPKAPSKTPEVADFIRFARNKPSDLDRGQQNLFNCLERCDALLENFKGSDWILENRAGFSFRNNQNGAVNRGCPGEPMPPREDYIPKLNVWIAFSSTAICTPFIQRVNEKFDNKVYLTECFEKRLIPFIKDKENHEDLENTVLWSDLIRPYTNSHVLARLASEGINYVDKNDNPGCKVKGVALFWNLLRNKVYRNWYANNEDELQRRILHCLRTLDMSKVARIVNDTEERINEMATTGAINEWSDKCQNYTGI
jgi:hypothetical protein